MTPWTDLTDKQRARVLDTLCGGGADYEDGVDAHEAARVVLLAARETHAALANERADVAAACWECDIDMAEAVPDFIRRLWRERREARATCTEGSRREGKLREALAQVREGLVAAHGLIHDGHEAGKHDACGLCGDVGVVDAALAPGEGENR